MARKKKEVPAVVEPVQAYIEGVAKHLVDRIYGPQGLPWGTRLTELEDTVIAVREVLSEKMLAQALEAASGIRDFCRSRQEIDPRHAPFGMVQSKVSDLGKISPPSIWFPHPKKESWGNHVNP